MRTSILAFSIGATVLASQQLRVAPPSRAVIPTVRASAIPTIRPIVMMASLQGTVRFHVEFDRAVVKSVAVTDAPPVPMLVEDAEKYVRSWRIPSLGHVAFDTAITFEYLSDCARTGIAKATLDLPFSARFVFYRGCTRDPSASLGVARNLEGVVRCDCPAHTPIGNAQVGLGHGRQFVRETTTDSEGRWALPRVPKGGFTLTITAPGYDDYEHGLQIEGDDRRTYSLQSLLSSKQEVISAADSPIYPEELRADGASGVVHVRLSASGAAIVDGNAPVAGVTLDNARTWKRAYDDQPVSSVTYSYVLENRDCDNPNPHVEIDFPDRVRIVGSSTGPCDDEGRAAHLNADRPLAMVSGPAFPLYPQIARTAKLQGTVNLHVHTNGETVSTMEETRSVQLLDWAAMDLLRAWHFADVSPRAFDSSLTFDLSAGGQDCHPLTPVEADIEPPLRIRVSVAPQCTIYNSSDRTEAQPVGPTVEGSVRCDCAARSPVAGAEIRLVTKKKGHSVIAHSDSEGRYGFRDLVDGDYLLSIFAPGFSAMGDVSILVRQNRPNGKVRDDALAPDSLRILSSDIPAYPLRALESGLTGEVHLKGAGSGASIVDGDPILAASALANVLSWKIGGGSGTPLVTFTYEITDDCANPNPHVRMKLPFEVNVVGKRRTGCGGSDRPSYRLAENPLVPRAPRPPQPKQEP